MPGLMRRAGLHRRLVCPMCHALRDAQDRVTVCDIVPVHENPSTNFFISAASPDWIRVESQSAL